MRNDLETYPLRKSLLTPVLLFGVDRRVATSLLTMACLLAFGFRLNLVTPTLAVLLLTVGLPALRRLARRDPWFFRVLGRHTRVSGFYPPLAPHDRRRQGPPTF